MLPSATMPLITAMMLPTRVTGMHWIAMTWLITGIETRVITPMTSSRASTMSATKLADHLQRLEHFETARQCFRCQLTYR